MRCRNRGVEQSIKTVRIRPAPLEFSVWCNGSIADCVPAGVGSNPTSLTRFTTDLPIDLYGKRAWIRPVPYPREFAAEVSPTKRAMGALLPRKDTRAPTSRCGSAESVKSI